MQNVYAHARKSRLPTLAGWRHAQVFGSTQAIISAVEAGLGVAFVSEFAARGPHRFPTHLRPQNQGRPLKRQLYITYLDRNSPTRLQREFLSFSLTGLKKEVPSPLPRRVADVPEASRGLG